MTKITIDTNVVGTAMKSGSDFRKAVESGVIDAYIAETSLTLDGLSKYSKIDLLARRNVHHLFKQSRWDEFIRAGVTFLLCPRLFLPRPIGRDSKGNEFEYTLFYKSPEHTYSQAERQNRYFELLEYIDKELNSGQKWLKNLSQEIDQLGGRYNNNEPWFLNLANNANCIGEAKVFKRFGDWADADAIAAHYAYGNDFFFTDDKASTAGSRSVLSQINRRKLTEYFDIKFISSAEIQPLI